jgi:hypothetical protein
MLEGSSSNMSVYGKAIDAACICFSHPAPYNGVLKQEGQSSSKLLREK